MSKKKIDYKSAGVDIDAGNNAVELIKDKVKSTHSKEVLTGIGSFGSLFNLKDILVKYKEPVMVQSIDGVGTKTIIARKMNKFNTIGIDLLSACANDILVMGAKPLTFLDYIANDKLKPKIVAEIVEGMTHACIDTGVSLVGGETAEMPDTYLPGEHDLVGIITGIVDKEKIITGKNIFSVVSYAWSGLGSAFGPALVLTLWWRKTTRKGIIAGLVTGFLTTIIWANIPELKVLVTERLSSFIFAFLAVYIVSLQTQNES